MKNQTPEEPQDTNTGPGFADLREEFEVVQAGRTLTVLAGEITRQPLLEIINN